MSRVDEIEARLAAATPGPWAIGTNEKNCLIIGSRQTQGWVCVGDPDAAPEAQEDAALIAAAPDDLAVLIEFARRVEAVLDDHVSTNEQVFDELDRAMKRLNGGAS